MNKILLALLFSSVTIIGTAQIITAYPYFTGFEGVQGTLNDSLPAGWSKEDFNGGMGNSGWEIIKNSPLSMNANTDSTAVHMFSNMSETNNDWLYTPGFEMQAGNQYTLTFWYNVKLFGASHEKCKIHIGSDSTSVSMNATPLWDIGQLTNETYQTASINYTPVANDVFYFGFHYYSDAFSYIFFIDDVTVTELVTGIEEYSNVKLSLSPNPCNDEITISGLETHQNYQVDVIDVTGKSVLTQQFSGVSNQVNVSQLIKGNYFLRVISENRKWSSTSPITVIH
jgi:hypothetical protein